MNVEDGRKETQGGTGTGTHKQARKFLVLCSHLFSLLPLLPHHPTLFFREAMPPAHAIDIPEVLIRIAAHLEKPALAAACRVRKAWFRPFTEQLWRSIEKDDFEGGRHRSLLEAMPRYATFVRELACPSFLPREVFLLGPELSRLTMFSTPDLDSDGIGWIQDILKQNPALESLSIESTHNIPEEQIMDAVKTMARLERLSSLRFETSWTLKETFLESVLDCLPLLKSFSLWGHPEYITSPSTLPDVEGSSRDIRKQPYQLEAVHLSIPWQLIDTATNFLTFCPLLKSLDIRDSSLQAGPGIPDLGLFARTLHGSCPELSSLIIGSVWLDVNYLTYLLSLGSPMWNVGSQAAWFRLRSLSIKNASAKNESVLMVIWMGRDVFKETLEDVEIDCDRSDPTGGVFVAMILESFKKLSRLSVEGVVVSAENLFQGDERVMEWASTKIVSLSFTVKSPTSTLHFSWYTSIQAHLDRFPMLDQSGVRFLEN